MREIGSLREFENGLYELVEDKIVPEKDKKSVIVKMNVYALLFIILSIPLVLLIMGSGNIDFLELSLLFFSYFIFIVVHELLHGISFVFDSEVSWKHIKFGLVLKSGMAYCISKVPVKVKVGRVSLMMPVYAVCLPMILLGFIFQNAAVVITGFIFLSGSVGDFYYIWKLRKTSSEYYMFEELPTESGYEVGYLLYKKMK